MKRLLTPLLMGALMSNAFAYDIVDRAKLVDDRFKTLEMMNPIGHDFFINIDANLTKDLTELQSDVEKLGDIDDSQDTEDQIADANEILEPYYNKEQVIRANFGLGFPLPSFTAWDTKIKPNFRVKAGVFAMLTPSKSKISFTALIDNLDEIPADIRTALKSCLGSLSDGDKILQTCRDNPINAITPAQYDAIVAQYPGVEDIEYKTDLGADEVDGPAIDVYAKMEAKAGLFNTWERGDHFFGDFNLYALVRQDIQRRADALLMLSGQTDTEYAENQKTNMAMDFVLGYKNTNYHVKLAVEEAKLYEMKADDAELNWGDNMLMRLHAQADYQYSFVKASPYLGSHSRDGYGMGDAYYLGVDWGASVWQDRLALMFKTQMDKEHYTLGVQAKLWILQLDLISRMARADEIDGIKIGDFYGANIRLFF